MEYILTLLLKINVFNIYIMGYKLKKHELICIAKYVVKHQNDKNISDDQLVSNFYEMLMHALDSNKTINSDDDSESENDSEQYIELDSDDDSYITNKKKKCNKK